MNIRSKFILVLFFGLVAVTVAICAAADFYLAREADAAFFRNASAQLDRIDDIIHIHFKGTEQAAKDLATLPEAGDIALARHPASPDADPNSILQAETRLTQWLAMLPKALPGVEAAFCGYKNGSFHSSMANAPPPGYDARSQSWYSDTAWGLAKTSITDIAISRNSKSLVATVAAKIKSNTSDTIGVAALVMSLGPLTNALRDIQIGKSGRILLFDAEGRVLFDPEAQENLLRPATETNALLQTIMQLPAGQHTLSDEGTDLLAASRIFPDSRWKAAILLERAEQLAPARETFYSLALVAALICLVFLGIGILLVIGTTRPLYALIRQSKALADGNGEALSAIAGRGPDIAAIQASFGQLTGRIMLLAQLEKEHATTIETNARKYAAAEQDAFRRNNHAAYRAASDRAAQSLALLGAEIGADINSLTEQMHHLQTGTNTQVLSAQTLQATIADMAAAATTISRQAAETEKNAERALSHVRKTEARFQESSHAVESLEDAAKNLAPGLEAFKSLAGDIALAIAAVRDVAEEINVLGLKLSIEISNAGETGKHFAPVAEEMRSLAEKAMTSAASMDTAVAALDQTRTAHALAVNKNATAAKRIVAGSAKTADSFAQTAASVGTTVEQMHVLATAMEGITLAEALEPEKTDALLTTAQEASRTLHGLDEAVSSLKNLAARLTALQKDLEADSSPGQANDMHLD